MWTLMPLGPFYRIDWSRPDRPIQPRTPPCLVSLPRDEVAGGAAAAAAPGRRRPVRRCPVRRCPVTLLLRPVLSPRCPPAPGRRCPVRPPSAAVPSAAPAPGQRRPCSRPTAPLLQAAAAPSAAPAPPLLQASAAPAPGRCCPVRCCLAPLLPLAGDELRTTPASSRLQVTVLCKDHDCVSTRRMETTTPSKNWVASKAENILRLKPQMGAKELQEKLQEQYGVTLVYDTVWRGRELALDKVYGKWSGSFELLYRWKAEVLKRMPGSVVEIDTMVVDGQVYFHRFFCALKPCIDGFREGCRPYLSIDSTALNGRWNGHLAAAVAVDGHTWMYPVAYGFIASETEDNWTWFMTHLKNAIGDPPLLAVCTDACKGLENAVASVFPQAEQRECFFHLMKNFKKRFQGFGRIYPAARAYREEVFADHMGQIFNESGEIWKWFRDNHKLLWYRCHFNPEIKCDFITNNLAEVFNNWIREIKDLPVAELADKIREMLMVLWSKRRRITERLPPGRILPAVMVQLRANTRGLSHLKVVSGGNWSAEVWDHTKESQRHIVKLEEKTCTCLEWQHTGKPCEHALAFITTQRNIDMEQFVHPYFNVGHFQAAYGREIEPMTDKSQWPEVHLPFPVSAPLAKRGVGRQRKLRIKGCLEGGSKKKGANGEENVAVDNSAPTNAKGKKMIRGPMTCKRCGEKGHRQASYKCPLNGTKKKARKPRVNKTKARKGLLSTPPRPTRDQILQDSPGRITRSQLAFLFGESTSAQPTTSAAPNLFTPPNLSTPTKDGSGGPILSTPTKKRTPKKTKKMTPRKKQKTQ